VSSYCAAGKITKRAVFEAALDQYLSATDDMALVLRRLDRLGRADDRLQREVEFLSLSFSVFVQLWLAHTPSVRDHAKPDVRSDAESRHRQFMDHLAQEFTGGRRFLDDLPRERVADEGELTAAATNTPSSGKASRLPGGSRASTR
jgi:AcrR family transcriptional regulator